jgi:hypothetical protein
MRQDGTKHKTIISIRNPITRPRIRTDLLIEEDGVEVTLGRALLDGEGERLVESISQRKK